MHSAPLPPFEAVVAEHGAVVLRVCRALLPPADADDAWSDTFLAALRAYPTLRPDSNIRGWLVTIAHRKAIDVIRRSRRHADPVADVPAAAVDDRIAVLEADLALRDALSQLAPKQREAVIYRYLADLSYDDVAVQLGGSVAAARRNAADGIARLRRLYPAAASGADHADAASDPAADAASDLVAGPDPDRDPASASASASAAASDPLGDTDVAR